MSEVRLQRNEFMLPLRDHFGYLQKPQRQAKQQDATQLKLREKHRVELRHLYAPVQKPSSKDRKWQPLLC